MKMADTVTNLELYVNQHSAQNLRQNKALNYGMERLESLPMSLRLIKETHGVLMHGVRGGKKMPSEFRKSQNWIGPSGCTLQDATFVPPPPNEADKAMGELEKYMHTKSGLPMLIDCALVHQDGWEGCKPCIA